MASLRAFRAAVPRSVELVFLQQCGRGSVQNLYNFRGTAKAVLASQHDVGAPNTYYEPTLRWLGAHPDASGADLAGRNMADDRDFVTYCCVKGDKLGELPRRLEPVVRTLLEGDAPFLPPVEMTPCFVAGGEQNFDLLDWLEAAFRKNRSSPTALGDFSHWLRDGLIVRRATGPQASARYRRACGLSLFVPRSEAQIALYRDEPLHHDCPLGKLLEVALKRPPRG